MKRVLFVNDEMVMGGVARILINMLNALKDEDYQIDVLVLHPHGELLEQLPSHVRVLKSSPLFKAVDINLKESIRARRISDVIAKARFLFLMKSGLIKKLIQRERMKILNDTYDIEIAAKEGFCTLFTAYGNSHRKLNWVHIDYLRQNYSRNHMGVMKDALGEIDLNIAVSDVARDAYKAVFEIDNVISIPNLMDINGIEQKLNAQSIEVLPESPLKLITVGRMHPQKAIHRMIRAMYALKAVDLEAHLTIVGDGPEREDLLELCSELNLNEQISFIGMRSNPFPLMKQADLFLLSSLYEGYPTTVIESFMAHLPVLSTEVSGIRQQIQNNVNGWICDNDEESFIRELIRLVRSPQLIYQAKQTLLNYHYDNDVILKQFIRAMEGDL